MERVIELLERKNHYLEKFFLISEAELLNFKSDDFDNLESFYACRDKILNIIKHIDDEVEKTNQQFSSHYTITPEQRLQMERVLSRKEEIVNDILALDVEILACIDKTKSTIIRELRGVKKGRQVIEKYHSGQKQRPQMSEEV